MPFDVDDIINTPCDLVVTISVTPRPITREVEPREGTEVCVHKPLVVSIDGTGHARAKGPDTQITLSRLAQ